jgi:high-affinity Fe2+/Pb2+ permease
MKIILAALILFILPSTADAYIGPGIGIGAIGTVFGVLFSMFAAFLGVLWYPFKSALKKFRREKEKNNS